MTSPSPDTLEREKDKLYVTEAELIRRLGVPERDGRVALDVLSTKADFPQKQKLWGGRRYWPAVKAWLDRNNGLSIDGRPTKGGRHDR